MFTKTLLSLSFLATLLAVGSALPARHYGQRDTSSTGTCSNTTSSTGTTPSTYTGNHKTPSFDFTPGNGTSNSNFTTPSFDATPGSGTSTGNYTTPNTVQPALPSNCTRQATVQAGDTCDVFSARNNVSTFQLANTNINGIDSHCSNLFPGEILCLGTPSQDCSATSVVQPGDTCGSIANTTGVSLPTLMANNPFINNACTNIYPGEVLCTDTNPFQYTILSPGASQATGQ